MSILANSETFFSHGHMGVFYEIFLKELNRIDGGKKKKKKKKRGETCRTIEGVISSVMTLNDVSYPRLCQWQ